MVTHIKTPDGKNRPFKFAWKALRQLADELGVQKLTELGPAVSELPLDKIPVFLFIGFEQGAKAESKQVDFTVDSVENWLDDDFSLFNTAFTTFGEQFGAGVEEGNVRQAKAKRVK